MSVIDGWAIITANVGGVDKIHPLPSLDSSVDPVFVTDDRRIARRAERVGWRSILIGRDGSGHTLSRLPKARPELFTTCPGSTWVDSRFEIIDGEFGAWSRDQVSDSTPIALYAHPARASIIEEAEFCIANGIAAEALRPQLAEYRSLGKDLERLGLFAGGIIVRRHTPDVTRFGQLWYAEIQRWDSRDQVSLPVSLRKAGLAPTEIRGDVYTNPHLVTHSHRVLSDPIRWFRRTIRRLHRRTLRDGAAGLL